MYDDHKQKHEPEAPAETEENGFVLEPAQLEVGAGYTVCVHYDEDDKPIVNLKTYGHVDMQRVRREILRVFPNAQIRQLSQSRTTTIVRKRGKRKKK